MGSIGQLKDLMSLNSCIEIADFEKHSGQIAKLLFGELAIRKGNTLYLFKENELEKYGFEVIEMRFNNKVNFPSSELYWAYINFLQVRKHIVMPVFNIEEDSIAYNYIVEAFPDCNIHQIEMKEIAKEGGALHCISWNIFQNY